MKRKFTEDQEVEIVRRYEAGESSEDIAADILPDVPTSGTNIRNVLRRRDVMLRPSAHRMNPTVTEAQRERAVALCRGGYTLQQAADVVGVSKETVFKANKAAGVSLPIGKPKRR